MMAVDSENISFSININSICSFSFILREFSSADIGKSHLYIPSDEFWVLPICKSKWRMHVLGVLHQKNKMVVGLERLDECDHEVELDFEYTLRNSNQTLYFTESVKCFIKSASGEDFYYHGRIIDKPTKEHNVLINGKQFRLCSDDTLIIVGKLTFSPCCCNASSSENLQHLKQDLKATFINKDFTDVVFTVGSDAIPAHKFILCSRSPVFKKLFESEMQEKSKNTIVISDYEKQDFESFLMFLYTGFLDDNDVNKALVLYSLGDKYDVKSLRDSCRNILSENLMEENACAILSLADMHSDESLKNCVIEYICANFPKIVPTDEWDFLIENNPRLAANIVKLASVKICPT